MGSVDEGACLPNVRQAVHVLGRSPTEPAASADTRACTYELRADPSPRPRSRVDPHHPRGRGRVRAPGACSSPGGKDSHRDAAAGRRRRSGRASCPFPVMHVDTGHNFPEVIEFRDRTRRGARRPAGRRLGAGVDRQRPGRRGDRARAPAATGCRPPRCSTRIEEHRLRRRLRRRPPRRGEGPGQGAGLLASATSSGSGTRRTSGPSCGTSTTAGSTQGEHIRVFPISQLDRARHLAVHRRRGHRDPVASTSPTSARCSSATACCWPIEPVRRR